jgi:hypothetical protein
MAMVTETRWVEPDVHLAFFVKARLTKKSQITDRWVNSSGGNAR